MLLSVTLVTPYPSVQCGICGVEGTGGDPEVSEDEGEVGADEDFEDETGDGDSRIELGTLVDGRGRTVAGAVGDGVA